MTTRDQAVTGGAQLDALLRTLPEKMQKNVTRTGLRAGAAVFLSEVKQNIPVDSGALRSTARISSRNTPQGPQVSVKVGGKVKGVDAWYAHLVEFGTRPHVIKPKQQGGALQFGGITTRSVQHPGTRARPFMRPAVDAKFPEAVEAIKNKIRDRLAKQGLNVPDPAPAGDE
jgi:HK97 gp10 family phage protein